MYRCRFYTVRQICEGLHLRVSTLDNGPMASTLSIMSQMQQNETRSHTIAMPVEVACRPQVKRPLAVCVHVAYGHIDPVKLVEWLEFQRILGVSFVGVYLMEDFRNESEIVFRYSLALNTSIKKFLFQEYESETLLEKNEHHLQCLIIDSCRVIVAITGPTVLCHCCLTRRTCK